MMRELVEELHSLEVSGDPSALEAAIERAPQDERLSSDDEADADGGANSKTAAQDDLDLMLQDELEADLPPFLELPNALTAAKNASTHDGALAAWSKLSAFSADDLLESDQWADVAPSLQPLLIGKLLPNAERDECAELHAALFAEAPPPQRTPIVLNACAMLAAQRAGGGGGGAAAASSSSQSAAAEDRSTLLCAQLVWRARLELCNDGIQLPVDVLDQLLDQHANLSLCPKEDTAASRCEPALLLAAMDPSARWVSKLLARARLVRGTWRALVTSGLVQQAEAIVRSPPPPPPPPSSSSSSALPSASRDQPPPSEWESRFALHLHHTCLLAVAVRHASSIPPDASSSDSSEPSFEGVVYDVTWASKPCPTSYKEPRRYRL